MAVLLALSRILIELLAVFLSLFPDAGAHAHADVPTFSPLFKGLDLPLAPIALCTLLAKARDTRFRKPSLKGF